MKSGIYLTVFCFLFISFVQAEERSSGIDKTEQFPNKILVEYNDQQLDLSLTGLTVRKKFLFRIYSMAHYLDQSSHISGSANDEIYNTILNDNSAKQISMIFLRDLKAEQIQDALTSGIRKNSSEEEYEKILPDVEKFKNAIYEDVSKGDEFILRWLPDGSLVSFFERKQISVIENQQFAKIMWSIWFSKDSVVDRKSLISKLLTSS